MAQPNSLLTKIRRWIASAIIPEPDVGEAWCIDCSINNGRTVIVPLNGTDIHVATHNATEGKDWLYLYAMWEKKKGKRR